ncbi:MAG: peptide ABC transporter substrate-binding protein [Bdellovibrio sp. CG10_big_fil_rev_8_21_14_0_10_47_8]|nr:MAG: peptide ABC transporter substrate-binding protein [Bdellovibrio sp. CG10_big_fil_rev_8_21_14_0_10_47_8]
MTCIQGILSILVVALMGVISPFSPSWAAPSQANAVIGGNYVINIRGEPPTIHPITSTDLYASNVHEYTLSTLLVHDMKTYEWKPMMAEKWNISKDGKVFTFWLRKDMTFHDGHPVTAEDVKFSFDAIFDPKYQAADKIPYYEGISKVEVVDPYQVKFYTKEVYFLNFETAAGMYIIPKHIYSDIEKSKKMNKELVGAGPYKIEKFEKGQRIVLKRYDKWFGNQMPEMKGHFNFDTVTLRFVNDENVYLEMLNKGDLDYDDLSPEQYTKKTSEGNWGKSVLKYKVSNVMPKGYRYVGWNLENPLFKDRDVRYALAHLMNRSAMISKFRYDLSVMATGPTEIYSDYASPKAKPILFDPKKARDLLTKAGWRDSDKNGVLDKEINGKKVEFRFTLLHSNKEYEKYLTFYKEDLKKAGIDMDIKYLEWNSFLKLLDESKFEAVSLGWWPGIEFDPKPQWHSSSAVAGGSNFIHYKVPEVDQWIDQGRKELDRKKRIVIFRKIYQRIADDAPYVFMFNEKYYLYANSARTQKSADTLKYAIGMEYWWLKP